MAVKFFGDAQKLVQLKLSGFPNLQHVVQSVLIQDPGHATFLSRRFRSDSKNFLANIDDLASDVLKIAGADLAQFCASYLWMCEQFFREEVFFRRHGRYRLSTLEDAMAEVYSNETFMRNYMQGLLISQLLWANHAGVFDCYVQSYLALVPAGGRHLEIGPGHGLFLHRAASSKNFDSVLAWDISETSLDLTRRALAKLDSPGTTRLENKNAAVSTFENQLFDSIVISEVFEHVESPSSLLQGVVKNMNKRGLAFINIPINSPAPDHIYLWRSEEAVLRFVTESGLRVRESHSFPATGIGLEEARKRDITISVVIIAEKI